MAEDRFNSFREGSCFNDMAKDCCNHLNNEEFFTRALKEHRRISIDCDRSFHIGMSQYNTPLYGEIVEVIPIFYTCSCVFMYEQGWSWYHTFDEIIWE